jgi:biopolymer transport protein ExbB/TolQ
MPKLVAKKSADDIVWKDKDDNLIPITKLTQEALENAIQVSERQIEKHKDLKDKFETLLFELKKEAIKRVKQQTKLQTEKL